jgi:hypothetical protein
MELLISILIDECDSHLSVSCKLQSALQSGESRTHNHGVRHVQLFPAQLVFGDDGALSAMDSTIFPGLCGAPANI